MLNIDSQHQGLYAPLNQAMTDSDSEEQLFLRHHQLNSNSHLENKSLADSFALTQHPPLLLNFKQQSNKNLRHSMQGNGKDQLQSEQKCKLNAPNAFDSNTTQSSSYTTNMQNTFRSVMMSDGRAEAGSSISSFNSDYDDRYSNDNVAILNNRNEGKDAILNRQMSTARKCCFVASLVLCFLAVLTFLWFIPCSDYGACPASVDRMKTRNWVSKYSNIEFKGAINVVNGIRKWERNLIFLYRGKVFFNKLQPVNANSNLNPKPNGVISLIGCSGVVAWYDEMHEEPLAIDCTLIDIDLNGQSDCLVIDEYGQIGVIHPISGQWYWRHKERTKYKIDETNFPVIIPDLDNDGVFEILSVTSSNLLQRNEMLDLDKTDFPSSHRKILRNSIRILSGRTGLYIGEGFEMNECDVVRNMFLDSSTQTVTYTCIRAKTEMRRSKTLGEIFALVTNKSVIGLKTLPISADISQYHYDGLRRENDAQRNIYSLSGRELVVENRGKCPENCNVTFILSDGRNGKVKILQNFTQAGMYGMTPVQWHLKNSKLEMSGFVMKFWKWSENESDKATKSSNNSDENITSLKISNQSKKTSSTMEKSTIFEKNLNSMKIQHQQNIPPNNKTTYNSGKLNKVQRIYPSGKDNIQFDHRLHKRESITLLELTPPSFLLTAQNAKENAKKINFHNLHSKEYKMEMITETVILILFLGADTRIENTSQSNIIQFCRNENNNGLVSCQPDFSNQEKSIFIGDLDQDDLLDMVSFTSTYVEVTDQPNYFKLVTYVRLLRLEDELLAFNKK